MQKKILINIPLGAVFAIIQSLFVINALLWLTSLAPTRAAIFWLIYAISAFSCAFLTSVAGLLELKWDAIILGTITGLVFIVLNKEGDAISKFIFLSFTALATYIFAALPTINFKRPKFINNLSIIIAGHILCDLIVAGSLLASIWLPWTRPFVAAEVFIILSQWYLLGGCPFTVVEAKLNDKAVKSLTQNGFLVYYGRTYFGIKINELKFEKILDYVFYIGTTAIMLLWFIYPK